MIYSFIILLKEFFKAIFYKQLFIFKKSNWEPNIEIDIKSGEDFPTKELNMLIDYFDVKIEDISEYIGNYVINQDLLREKISNYLRSNFNRKDSQVIVKTSKTKKTS